MMDYPRVGDVVMLNSGSPEMTVTDVNDRRIVCVWPIDGNPKKGIFSPPMLTLIRARTTQ